MKNNYDKIILLCLCLFVGQSAFADAVEIDGIYYNLVSKIKSAEVTRKPSGEYSGSINIPETVTYNGDGQTYTVTSIGSSAFYNCYGLTSITIPNRVTSIGELAFRGCDGLTSITIPNSVTSIGSNAFYLCSGLTKAEFASIESLCSISFDNYESNPLYYAHHLYIDGKEVKDLVIPNSVTSIGYSAFFFCSGLTSITIPNSVTGIGSYAFYGCSGLTSITIPNSVTSIGSSAFSYCSGLTSITIPNSVTSIGDEAFKGCSGLTSITIPNSVTSIGYSAFKDCPELTDVYCYAENVPSTWSDAFEGSYIEYATLHVPEVSINTYKERTPWSSFGTIKPLEDGDIPEPEIKKCATPSISYNNGKLSLSCDTEGAEFVSDIKDTDIKKHYDNEITLTATYNISVFATKADYENSDTVTATLCWIDATPRTEGLAEDAVTEIEALPVLIQSSRGVISVGGIDSGIEVSVYSTDGMKEGSVISVSGQATIPTNMPSGSIAIVRIGNKSVKVPVQ